MRAKDVRMEEGSSGNRLEVLETYVLYIFPAHLVLEAVHIRTPYCQPSRAAKAYLPMSLV
jgi:hypothetical protein